MADVVLNQTLFEGDKKIVTHYQNVSDNSGGTTKIVDVSALTARKDGATPATVTLNKIWYSVSMSAKVDAVKLMWDADTDATFITVEGDGYLDYSSIGGIKNNEATNFTGDVVIVMPACTANDSATITCEWLKNY
jgi:hypothetical protein|tara:strand:- start:2945 stop:3349 length:405 start_codon:yes stop_codon:yes gene_type:complete